MVSEDEEEVEEIPVEPEPVVEEEEPIQEEEIVEEPPIVEETPKPQIIDLDEEKIQEIQQNELVTDIVVDEPSEDHHVVTDSSTVQPEFIKPTPEELPEKPEDLPEEREPVQQSIPLQPGEESNIIQELQSQIVEMENEIYEYDE